MAQRNGRNFGNSTPPTIYGNTYGTYYDISNMPKREDAFTGYRTGRVNAVWNIISSFKIIGFKFLMFLCSYPCNYQFFCVNQESWFG